MSVSSITIAIALAVSGIDLCSVICMVTHFIHQMTTQQMFHPESGQLVAIQFQFRYKQFQSNSDSGTKFLRQFNSISDDGDSTPIPMIPISVNPNFTSIPMMPGYRQWWTCH